MITFMILLIAAIITVMVLAISLLIGGTVGVILFGDVIVFAIIIFLIVRWIIKRRNK